MGKGNPGLLCELMASMGELLQQLRGLPEEKARTRPEPDEWSVVEVLQHLADIDETWLGRFRDTLAGKAELSPYNPADWEAARSAAERQGLSGVLRRAYSTRALVLDAVSGMEEADLAKSARHPRYGILTVLQMVEKICSHDRDHAQQIAKTRAQVEKLGRV